MNGVKKIAKQTNKSTINSSSMNERLTENFLRKQLEMLGYFTSGTNICVEEQSSKINTISRLLKTASKTGKGGAGFPEFIVTDSTRPDFVLLIECKADAKRHISDNLDRPVEFAVDGAIHYGSYLAKDFNVICVGVSGQTEAEIKISSYLYPKGKKTASPLKTSNDALVNSLLPWEKFVTYATYDRRIQKLREEELMAYSRDLHIFMRDHAQLTESEKPLLVSGTLLALQYKPFAKAIDDYKSDEFQLAWLEAIKKTLESAQMPSSKKENIAQPYTTIAVSPALGKPSDKKIAAHFPQGVLFALVKSLYEKVWPFINVHNDFDIVGKFYEEFLKYTGGDKKALGIVLTPRHITELFSLLANVSKTSTVLDICTGTGGFLVSAMFQMMKNAVTEEERNRIKLKGLIGVEHLPNMYALAASNMILRGDGKANLFFGSCFDTETVADLKNCKADVGLMNPPYAQRDKNLHELVFFNHMLNLLTPGGVGIAIVPVSCVTAPSVHKENLLKNHTLEAVMSMPIELFYPVGVVTCIVVFTAHRPHAESGKKTWFGYWREDGFTKTKHLGRIDKDNKWENIRDRWLEAYRNREVRPGESVTQHVTAADEWLAEAYMETDYSTLTEEDFEAVLRDYAIFNLKNLTSTQNAHHGVSNAKN